MKLEDIIELRMDVQYLFYNIILPLLILVIALKLLSPVFSFLSAAFWTWLISSSCNKVHGKIDDRKKELFKKLTDLRAGSKGTASDDSFTVLEIGVGGGYNFVFYPRNSVAICVEQNQQYKEDIERKLVALDGIKLKEFIVGEVENLSCLEDGCVDAVVGTFVMCCVKQKEVAFKEVCRVLKPGGMYVFIEHKEIGEESFMASLSQLWGVKPVMKETEALIRGTGFAKCEFDHFIMPKDWNPFTFSGEPCIMGTATK